MGHLPKGSPLVVPRPALRRAVERGEGCHRK